MRGSTMAMLGALSSMLPNTGHDTLDPHPIVLHAKAKKSFGSKPTKRCIGKRTRSLKERARRRKAAK